MPVFNGAATLPELAGRCRAALRECAAEHELIFVNDGSQDDSWSTISELAASADDVRGIDLARNYGQHNALLAGIREARCEVIVTIDDDLQNPPEEIPTLLAALNTECDVVYGEPIVKRHGIGRRLATRITVRALGALGGRTAPMVSAFRAFHTELRDGFSEYTGPDVSIDGLLTWRTERFRSVPVRHDSRAHGDSNYSLVKLVRHALTMITAFSTRPLRIASGLGFLVILFGIAVLVYVLVSYLTGGRSVPGFAFLASVISIFAGAQLFAVGVIGEYLARVHVRVMSKPSYAVRSTAGAGSARRRPARAVAAEVDGAGAPARILEWDSDFWGFPIARVSASRLSPGGAERVAAWCEEAGIRCAFLLAAADDRETAIAAVGAGFRAVDTRVTLKRPADAAAPGPGQPPAAAIRPAAAADEGALVELARRSHTDTRFFFDPNFEDGRAAEMYGRWVRRGLREDSRRLLVAEADGSLLGYVLLADEPPTIDLIAVAEPARGQGIGGALVEAALAEQPQAAMTVVTQARNLAALCLYQAHGFELAAAETWYHRWA